MQRQFLDVIDRDETARRFRASLDLTPLPAEVVPLGQALGRALAEDVVAPPSTVAADPGALMAALRGGLDCDAILLSGGASKGPGDLSYRAVAELGPPASWPTASR